MISQSYSVITSISIGKTRTFLKPLIERLLVAVESGGVKHAIDAVPGRPFVLVLAPTRELVIQVCRCHSLANSHVKAKFYAPHPCKLLNS